MHKAIKFEIPYNMDISKNKKFIGKTKKILNPKYINAKEEIYWICKSKLKKIGLTRLPKTKILVSLEVFKPNNRGDVINLTEGICDALKKSIDVDDNMYSLFVDWEIDKNKPRINVTLYCQSPKDQVICPNCLILKNPSDPCIKCGSKAKRIF